MTDVFSFIFNAFSGFYSILKGFVLTFDLGMYSFSFSMWDFLCTLFILSCLVPLVVSPDGTGRFTHSLSGVFKKSERNDDKNVKRK